jgi:hypothetical protein
MRPTRCSIWAFSQHEEVLSPCRGSANVLLSDHARRSAHLQGEYLNDPARGQRRTGGTPIEAHHQSVIQHASGDKPAHLIGHSSGQWRTRHRVTDKRGADKVARHIMGHGSRPAALQATRPRAAEEGLEEFHSARPGSWWRPDIAAPGSRGRVALVLNTSFERRRSLVHRSVRQRGRAKAASQFPFVMGGAGLSAGHRASDQNGDRRLRRGPAPGANTLPAQSASRMTQERWRASGWQTEKRSSSGAAKTAHRAAERRHHVPAAEAQAASVAA